MLIRDAKYLMLGTRFKRLGERILSEIREVYREQDIEFETSWFPVFYVMQDKERCTMQELSEFLGVSHSAISQLLAQLQRKGYIHIEILREDQRRKTIVLTPEGRQLLVKVQPVWKIFEMSFRENFSPDVLQMIEEVEDTIDNGTLQKTASRLLSKEQAVTIREGERSETESFVKTESLRGNYERSLVIAAEGLLIGLLGYRLSADHLIIDDLYIIPAYRRRGYGTQLLNALIGMHGRKPLQLHHVTLDVLQLLQQTGLSFFVNKSAHA